jgi:hypothetical protein
MRHPSARKQQTIGEIGVDAKQHSSEQGCELRLAFAIDEVSRTDGTGDDADDQAVHDSTPRIEASDPNESEVRRFPNR